MAEGFGQDEEEEPRIAGPVRLALLLPAAAIVVAVAFLVSRNPSAQDVLDRDDIAATATAVAAVVPPAPTATATLTPPARDNDFLQALTQDPFGFRRGPILSWRPGPPAWENQGVRWAKVEPRWWQDGPVVNFVGRDRNVYRFHIDGFRSGEAVAPDGIRLDFNVAGHLAVPYRVALSASTHKGTGLDLAVTFDRNRAGLIGPALRVRVTGNAGSRAEVEVPYHHSGVRPERTFRLSYSLGRLLTETSFRELLPRDLPGGSTMQWAGYVAGAADARAVTVLVPSGDGWVSLLQVQGTECAPVVTGDLGECFGGSAPHAPFLEQLDAEGVAWSLGHRHGVWVATAQFGPTHVLFAAPDREIVVRAAASVRG